ncbi:hypothetical protein ABID42_004515 [Arcicella rosea]
MMSFLIKRLDDNILITTHHSQFTTHNHSIAKSLNNIASQFDGGRNEKYS